MRLFVMGLVGAALATPANACPQGTRCISRISGPAELASIRIVETARAPIVRPVTLTMRASADAPADRQASLRSSLTTFEPAVTYADAVEMPWIWAVLASEVKNHLPCYEDSNQFSVVLSPVVVTMPTESTPGLGLSGDF